MSARSIAEINLDAIVSQFHYYYFDYDDHGMEVDPKAPGKHDRMETHNFEMKEHAAAFIKARCNQFEVRNISATSPRIYRCTQAPFPKQCTAYAKWFIDENKVLVNFCHSGHRQGVGQYRFNEFQTRFIEFFTIFFWRRRKTVAWNIENICYCFKRWFDMENPLHHISVYDVQALKRRINLNYNDIDVPVMDEMYHYTIAPVEKRMRNIPFPPTVSPGEAEGDWVYKGFTDSEWNDVDDNVWIPRRNSGPVLRIVSGKAFHMAKHILEFACNYLRIGYALSHDKKILGDWKYLKDLKVAEFKFCEFKKPSFNIFSHIRVLGLTMLIFWERHIILDINSRALKKFDEAEAIKFHGKYMTGSTLRLPKVLVQPAMIVDKETGRLKNKDDPRLDHPPEIIMDLWNVLGINKIFEILEPVLEKHQEAQRKLRESQNGQNGEDDEASFLERVERQANELCRLLVMNQEELQESGENMDGACTLIQALDREITLHQNRLLEENGTDRSLLDIVQPLAQFARDVEPRNDAEPEGNQVQKEETSVQLQPEPVEEEPNAAEPESSTEQPATSNTKPFDYIRWKDEFDDLIRRLTGPERRKVNIWTEYKIPPNGYIPTRFEYMTGLPLKAMYRARQMEKLEKEEALKKQAEEQATPKQESLQTLFPKKTTFVQEKVVQEEIETDPDDVSYASFDEEEHIRFEVLPLHDNTTPKNKKKKKKNKNKNKNKK